MSNQQNDVIREELQNKIVNEIGEIIDQMELAEECGTQGETWQEIRNELERLHIELDSASKGQTNDLTEDYDNLVKELYGKK